MIHVLFNPKAGSNKGKEKAQSLENYLLEKELVFHDLTEIEDQGDFLESLPEGDSIVLCGGDGTLNHFINEVFDQMDAEFLKKREIFFYGAGSGNDFLNDINAKAEDGPILLNPYLEHLPRVEINGKIHYFINDVGMGIDGYVCQEGNRKRGETDKPINYTLIAVKGLLGAFRPVDAKVTIDGVTKEYHKVWMVPTMNGRFFGGGMMATPQQDRMNEGHKVSVLVFHGMSIIKTLLIFPTVFTGKHVKYTKYVEIKEAKEVEVEFSRPCPLQIDGETIRDISYYHVKTSDVK